MVNCSARNCNIHHVIATLLFLLCMAVSKSDALSRHNSESQFWVPGPLGSTLCAHQPTRWVIGERVATPPPPNPCFAHNLVIEEKKPRIKTTNRDVPSGKRACWVGAVGAAAWCAARAWKVVLVTLGGGEAFFQAVFSQTLGNCGRSPCKLRICRLRTPSLFKVKQYSFLRSPVWTHFEYFLNLSRIKRVNY